MLPPMNRKSMAAMISPNPLISAVPNTTASGSPDFSPAAARLFP
jgi:hypothetical protein